jgi:hypothetical protein
VLIAPSWASKANASHLINGAGKVCPNTCDGKSLSRVKLQVGQQRDDTAGGAGLLNLSEFEFLSSTNQSSLPIELDRLDCIVRTTTTLFN